MKKVKLGILGGGQLGRMLIQSAMDWNLDIKILDPDPYAPCKDYAQEFVEGAISDYKTVMEFGADLDVLTIEIEHVNTEALEDLQKQGVKVYPQPEVIKMIQDKRTQKQFYRNHDIPTSKFFLIDGVQDLGDYESFLPAVMKIGKGGYDGRGVAKINSLEDKEKGFEAPSVLEKLVDIEKEVSIIVARNAKGETKAFPPVELVYHESNLVDYLLGPAHISMDIAEKAEKVAIDVVEKMEIVGILAVELFIDKNGEILVNEVAPRPHNSGHQTIEANITSQYEQHLRAILGLPLGSTKIVSPSAMVNVLGSHGHEGDAVYDGMEEILDMEGVYVHLYGKKITKPERKMGHVTIIDEDHNQLVQKIQKVKDTLKVVTEEEEEDDLSDK